MIQHAEQCSSLSPIRESSARKDPSLSCAKIVRCISWQTWWTQHHTSDKHLDMHELDREKLTEKHQGSRCSLHGWTPHCRTSQSSWCGRCKKETQPLHRWKIVYKVTTGQRWAKILSVNEARLTHEKMWCTFRLNTSIERSQETSNDAAICSTKVTAATKIPRCSLVPICLHWKTKPNKQVQEWPPMQMAPWRTG